MGAGKRVGHIDKQHRLQSEVPPELPVGSTRFIALLPHEDAAGSHWAQGVANEWSAELPDQRQDIYMIEDGQPLNASP